MAIGHHIADRGKVVERRRNLKHSNKVEEEKNFIQIGEGDVYRNAI